MLQCIGRRGARGRTGVFDGLTLKIENSRLTNAFNTLFETNSQNSYGEWNSQQSYLIGNDPKITPLQLSAAIALSACRKINSAQISSYR